MAAIAEGFIVSSASEQTISRHKAFFCFAEAKARFVAIDVSDTFYFWLDHLFSCLLVSAFLLPFWTFLASDYACVYV